MMSSLSGYWWRVPYHFHSGRATMSPQQSAVKSLLRLSSPCRPHKLNEPQTAAKAEKPPVGLPELCLRDEDRSLRYNFSLGARYQTRPSLSVSCVISFCSPV